MDVLGVRGLLDALVEKLWEAVKALWEALTASAGAAFRDLWQEMFPPLVVQYAAAAGDLAAAWYDDPSALPNLVPAQGRELVGAGVGRRSQGGESGRAGYFAEPVDLVSDEELRVAALWALNDRAGADALSALNTVAERTVFGAFRDTIAANVAAEPGTRWARYASATACGFCRMLATRGDVYTSEEAATQVVGRGKDMSLADRRARAAGHTRRKGRVLAVGVKTRGTQAAGDKFHDKCRCIGVPIRPGESWEPPAYYAQWDDDYIEAVRRARKPQQRTVKRSDRTYTIQIAEPGDIAREMEAIAAARGDYVGGERRKMERAQAKAAKAAAANSPQAEAPRQGDEAVPAEGKPPTSETGNDDQDPPVRVKLSR